MRIKHMQLHENLSLPDVADVLAAVGMPMDRTGVGRALQRVAIKGVEEPAAPGARWRIPRSLLAEVVAACLYRRQLRSHDRCGADLRRCRLDAAELLLRNPDLAGLVPRRLKVEVFARQQARQRAAEERLRLAEEAERHRVAVQEAAWRRKQEEERELYERIEREREREAHERVMNESYRLCFVAALKVMDLPRGGPTWPELPEALQVRRDFPYERPGWWAAPPKLYAAVKDDMPNRDRYRPVEPDFSELIPSYVPGAPWPWRRPEAEDDADGAAA
jgi:hypothetical protein